MNLISIIIYVECQTDEAPVGLKECEVVEVRRLVGFYHHYIICISVISH